MVVLVLGLVTLVLILGLLTSLGVSAWVVGEVSFVSQALSLLLLDLTLELTVNLALAAVCLVLALESIAGNESRSGAEWAVSWALHVSDLLTIEVAAQTASFVAESVGGVDGNVLAVGGNIEVVAEDLDTSVVHLFNVDDGSLAVLVADLSWERFDALSVDANLDLGFAQTLLSLWSQLNLGLLSEEDGDFALLSSNVLGQNGDWVLFRAVLGQNMDATFSSLAGETVGNVVKGVDVVALQLASWLRFGTEESVGNVLWDRLGSGEWKDSLEGTVGLDILEGETRAGLDELNAGELSVWGDLEGELSLSFSGTLVAAVVAHVWVEEGLDGILNVVAGVSELFWEFGELDLELTLVEGGGLLFSNFNADWRDGEALLLIFLAFLCLAGFGLGVLGHFLVAFELSDDLDLMWHSLAGFSVLEFSLHVNLELILKQFLAEDEKLVAFETERLWAFVFSFKFKATIWLSLSIWSLTDSLTESLEGFGRAWKSISSFIGGITGSTTDVHAARRLRELEKILDGGWVLVVEDLLDGLEFTWGAKWDAFTDEGNCVDGSILGLIFLGSRRGGGRAVSVSTLLFLGTSLLVLLPDLLSSVSGFR